MSGKRQPGSAGGNAEVEDIDRGTAARINMPMPAPARTKNVCLNVLLARNRDNPGWLRVEVDGVPLSEFRVLGRGSTRTAEGPTGNPTRNQLHYAGDTPTGDYVSPEMASTDAWKQRSYGPWGAVRLKAVGGDALLAERLGRTGLLVHGGDPGKTPALFGGFNPTLGCLRLSNPDMKRLRDLLSFATEDSQRLACDAISVDVRVREF